MVTGNDVFRQALVLLNYPVNNGGDDATNNNNLFRRSLPIVNQIYADLWGAYSTEPFRPLSAISEEISLTPHIVNNIMPYGVAMLLAQTDGDVDNQTLYASLYNQRRSSAVCSSGRIEDRMPRVYL